MSDVEHEAVKEERVAEAAGETVGEAKWTALRQLEQRFPGLDKGQVEFTVLSEGERGLLGVGFVPARVIARVAGPIVSVAREAEPPEQGPLSPRGEQLREFLVHVRDALDVDAAITVREGESMLTGTFHGRELGLVIGKHGQTIDAIQYLAASVVGRRSDDPTDVVVDAAGYRDRRRATLEAIADRAAARASSSGSAVALEPMSAFERKVVHIHLKNRGDVVTASEGAEPNRYIVVRPAP
jgi:spoIIIJ-associated protein